MIEGAVGPRQGVEGGAGFGGRAALQGDVLEELRAAGLALGGELARRGLDRRTGRRIGFGFGVFGGVEPGGERPGAGGEGFGRAPAGAGLAGCGPSPR
jgi:hypothetical protein